MSSYTPLYGNSYNKDPKSLHGSTWRLLQGVSNYQGWKNQLIIKAEDEKLSEYLETSCKALVKEHMEKFEKYLNIEIPEIQDIKLSFTPKKLKKYIVNESKDQNLEIAFKNEEIEVYNIDTQNFNEAEQERINNHNEIIDRRVMIKEENRRLKISKEKEDYKQKCKQNSEKLSGIIKSSLSSNILNSLPEKYKDDGRKLFKYLTKNYGGKSHGMAYSIKKEFFNIHQNANETMANWIARLEGLRNELNQTNGQNISDSDMIVKLLGSSNKQFEVITQRESNTLDLTQLKIVLQEAEIMQNINSNNSKSDKVLKYQTKEKICFNCGKNGHTKNECKGKQASKELIERKKKEFFGDKYKAPQDHTESSESKTSRRWQKSSVKLFHTIKGDTINQNLYYDTCAPIHVTGNKDLLFNYEEHQQANQVFGLNDQSSIVKGKGELHFTIQYEQQLSDIICADVQYVPDSKDTILSASILEEIGIYADSERKLLYERNSNGNKEYIAELENLNGLYIIKTAKNKFLKLNHSEKKTLTDWHKSFTHINFQETREILKRNNIEFYDDSEKCEECLLSKISQRPFRSPEYQATKPAEIISCDLFFVPKETYDGEKIGSIYIDNYSDYWIFEALKQKNDQPEMMQKILPWIERQSDNHIKRLKIDGGGEYLDSKSKQFYSSLGIQVDVTLPGTPEMNGKAERAIRTLSTLANATLMSSGLGDEFWADACRYVVFTHNRLIKKKLDWKSPNEILLGSKGIDIERMPIFGQDCITHLKDSNRNKKKKFTQKGAKGKFIGFSDDRKLKVLIEDETTYRIIETRTVEFLPMDIITKQKTKLLIQDINENETYESSTESTDDESIINEDTNPNQINVNNNDHNDTNNKNNSQEIDLSDTDDELSSENDNEQDEIETDNDELSNQHEEFEQNPKDTIEQQLLTTELNKDDLIYTAKHDINLNITENNVLPENSKREKRKVSYDENENDEYSIKKPKVHKILKLLMKEDHLVDDELKDVPRTIKEALNNEVWKTSYFEEMKSFILNNVIMLTKKPKERDKLPKWKIIFKNKYDENGQISRHKTRLTMKGYTQTQGIDYEETFAPVINKSSFRLLLSLALQNNMKIKHYDIKTAFLIPEIQFKQFAEIPEGLIENLGEIIDEIKKDIKKVKKENKKTKNDKNKNDKKQKKEIKRIIEQWENWILEIKNNPDIIKTLCVELLSPVYGSKQGAHDWNAHFVKSLSQDLKYEQMNNDPCVFIKQHENNQKSYLGVYTDDIIHIPIDKKEEQDFMKKLKTKYEITDKGELNWFTGIHVKRDWKNNCIYLDQETAIDKLLTDHDMQNCNAKATPMVEKIELVRNPINEKKVNATNYRSIIGSLIFIMTNTRPDICFAVTKLAQYMDKPYEQHLKALLHVLRYLKGTKQMKLKITKDNDSTNSTIIVYADADFASDTTDRKSMLGYVIKYNENIVSWKSKKQKTIALSTTESEIYSLTESFKEALWIRNMLNALGITIEKIKIYEDNTGAIAIVKNQNIDSKTKHIDIKTKFLNHSIKENNVDLNYIKSENQLADTLTKPLGKVKFEKFREALNVIGISIDQVKSTEECSIMHEA